ncbi:glycoside hydrolase family 108 protein [Acinetobacter seifertii]|uniref:glycoside hydrolase family 108 protein n=1 Tax=Acinetobacter seifertii TaxID=1530123 RepID=UPI00124EAC61|nr:glycoside hydrolase family 108 protein [Acinetobacter seifertii]
MSITFDEVFERTIGHEGGYVNNPKDPGGETNWGITIKTARENGYTGSMKSMSRLQAKEIYRVAFWNRTKCDQYTGAISYQIFDAAVNHGIGNAIRMLQRAVGVLDDGAVGNETLGAIKKMTLDDVLILFIAERLEFYTKLSTFNSFGRGWARRVVGNLRYAAGDTP